MRTYDLKILLALASVSALIAGCDGLPSIEPPNANNAAAAPSAEQLWETTIVTGQPYVQKIELPGASVRGFETTKLMAKVGGYVKEIKKINGEEVDIGTFVGKGAELVVLEIPEMIDELREKEALLTQVSSEVVQAGAAVHQKHAELKQRNAEVDEAVAAKGGQMALLDLNTTKHQRIKKLVEGERIGSENLDEATFDLDAAKSAVQSAVAAVATARASVEAARANLDKAEADKKSAEARVDVTQAAIDRLKTLVKYATISAPFQGVITKRMVDHGAFVRPATNNSGAMPLFEITRIDKVRIVGSVPNSNVTKIEIGQKIVFHSIGGLSGVSIGGSVSRSAQALSPDSRMMRIEVFLNNPLEQETTNRKISLKPGMFGTVSVIINEWDDLAVVPSSALATDESGQPYIMLVAADDVCHRQNVEKVFDNGTNVGLSSGVKPGKVVVIKDVAKLKNGERISLKRQ